MSDKKMIVKLGKEVKISPKSVGILHTSGFNFSSSRPVVEIPFYVDGQSGGTVLIELDTLERIRTGGKVTVESAVKLARELKGKQFLTKDLK